MGYPSQVLPQRCACITFGQRFGAFETRQPGRKKKLFEDRLKKSLWYDLACVLAEGSKFGPESLAIKFYETNGKKALRLSGKSGETVLSYLSDESDQYRLADRMGAFSSGNGSKVPDRAEVLQRLGIKSRKLEGQFSGDSWQWSTMAYYLDQEPDLYDRVMRYAWLDRAPIPWRVKAVWAHHRYVVGLKDH